jgi:hypothetical protein
MIMVPWIANLPPCPDPASTELIPGLLPTADPPRSSVEGPPPPRRPGNYTHQNPVSSTGVQLRDNLKNIYDLVFELRKEVDDLHFWVHSTNNKVVTLLHLLATMSATFPSHPDGVSSEEMPRAATKERNNMQ